jgi:hypothetical protein
MFENFEEYYLKLGRIQPVGMELPVEVLFVAAAVLTLAEQVQRIADMQEDLHPS